MILKASSRFSSKSPFMASACLSSNSLSLSKVQISTFCNGSPRKQGLRDSPPSHSFSPSPAFHTRKFSSEKKSFAVVAGELFIGMATRLFKPRKLVGSRSRFVVNRNDELGKRRRCSPRRDGRIGALVEDPCDAGIIWEQREKDVIAEKERRTLASPGFSFSAAGLLFPYHLGVAQFLIEKGYITENTPLAGASAGSIVCAAIASGISMKDALKAAKLLAEDCRLNGTAFRIGAVLREFLVKFLPDDVHVRSNGRVRVAVTQILWRPRGLLVDRFDSKEDFINAVFASSFIPGYLAPRPATMFRNKLCVDGGLTLFMPPTSASRTIKVCAFPASRLGLRGIGISPDCNPKNRATPREFFSWALEPADDIVLDQLFECGYRDAAVWAGKNPVENLVGVQSDSIEDVHSYGRCIGMDACSKSQALNDANTNSEATLSTNLCGG